MENMGCHEPQRPKPRTWPQRFGAASEPPLCLICRPSRNDHCARCEENSESEDVIGEDIDSEGLFSGDEECVGELELELAIDVCSQHWATSDVSGGEVGLEAAGSLGKVDALAKLAEEPTHPTSSAVDQELEELV
ncbi:hypothetical protein F0562_015724 [Nyssa sinensis]|uniref:Uncharacterized protein n=1 Tax=Nyssa sinensis TaxID=561372 RepID=A0A5J4ZI28_9ASTE|nr:hypothetical protein F0562_015724 [Nyssa sinensis]